MFKNLTSPFSTASSVGVFLRYAGTIVSSVIAILSIMGWLTPAQVAEISHKVEQISLQVPGLVAAVSGLIAMLIPLYAILTKSSSDKAAAVAKTVDKELPANAPVEIVTPAGIPNIVVPASKA